MTDFNTNLNAFFKCDEALASDELEEDLNTFSVAILAGAPSVETGKFGGARGVGASSSNFFSGSRAESALDLHDGSGDSYTVTCWVKLSSTSGTRYPVMRWEAASNRFEWYLSSEGGNCQFNYRNSSAQYKFIKTTESASAGVWSLFIGGYDSANNRIFASIDGNARVFLASSGAPIDLGVNNPPLDVGAYHSSSSGFLDGDVDNIGLWKGMAFTDAEISEYWNGGDGTFYPFGESPPASGDLPATALLHPNLAPFFTRHLPVHGHLKATFLDAGSAAITVVSRQIKNP